MTFAAIKDPDAVLDYRIDWIEVLSVNNPTDIILSSSWVADNTLVIDSNGYTDSQTTVWVSGGTVKKLSNLVNSINTVGGRTHVRTIKVSIKDT